MPVERAEVIAKLFGDDFGRRIGGIARARGDA
jgi:hypothetical protein